MAQQARWVAVVCLVLAMALWGSSFIALKFAFREVPSMWVIFARMALGSLVFLLAWRWRGGLNPGAATGSTSWPWAPASPASISSSKPWRWSTPAPPRRG